MYPSEVAGWRFEAPARLSSLIWAQKIALASGLIIALAFLGLSMLGPGRAWLGLGHALLLALAGLGTGVVFPTASAAILQRGAPVERAAAWVELADHAGAAVAAVLATVVLVPLVGLTRAATLLVALQALALGASALAVRARSSQQAPRQ